MTTKQERIDSLVNRLRDQGFRITPQRMAILQQLVDSKDHLSAEEIFNAIHDQYPMIGLATIYKTINLLTEIGEITELNFINQATRFEMKETPSHPHFICKRCGCVIDLEHQLLSELPDKVSLDTGLKIVNARLDFYGICPNCQSG